MAGASARASEIVPCRFRRFAQPSTTPGTVTVSGPYSGMLFTPRRRELRWRGRAPGTAARVEPRQALRLRVVHDREQVSADPVHRRLDDGEDGGGGDRRVDRVAALAHHLQAGGGRQRLAGRDHRAARHHDRPRRPWIGCRAVARKLGGQGGLREQDDERRDGEGGSGLHFFGLGMNGGTSCPRAEQSIRAARRRVRVSGFFADWIHQATVLL